MTLQITTTETKRETAVRLAAEAVDRDFDLLVMVSKLSPQDQLIYLPRIEQLRKQTEVLIEKLKS